MWKVDVVQGLKRRDLREKYPFKDILKRLSGTLRHLLQTREAYSSTRKRGSRLSGTTSESTETSCYWQIGRVDQFQRQRGGNPASIHDFVLNEYLLLVRVDSSFKKTSELEEKVALLKTELANVYRTHGSNAQKLLDLNEKLDRQEVLLAEKEQQ